MDGFSPSNGIALSSVSASPLSSWRRRKESGSTVIARFSCVGTDFGSRGGGGGAGAGIKTGISGSGA
jgi:hypothetical protein